MDNDMAVNVEGYLKQLPCEEDDNMPTVEEI